ncbi:MAG: bile acid:sodium symporter family protein [Bacteroidia bacterium]|nr:bile acid:sodium symporter family protein [Bacteroidia bacterium]
MSFIGQNINLLLNVVLGMIMFGLGLSLKKHDFKVLFDQPRSLAVGLFSQMILLPILAYILVSNATLPVEFKVGIMILSVCPGGITSNLVSYFVKGNVALSVSLTVSNAVLSLISIPLLVNVFLWWLMPEKNSDFIALPLFDTFVAIFLVTLVPAGLGMLVRTFLGKKILQIQKVINIILPLLLLLVFATKFLAGQDHGGTSMTANETMMLTPYVIAFNVLSMLMGFLIGIPFMLSFKNRITMAIEVGLHNTALGLLIAGQLLNNTEMEKPALVYALYSFAVTFGVSWLLIRLRLHRLKKRSKI